MIPKTPAPGTDARVIRCDDCLQPTYVTAAATTEEEIRAVAAKALWTTVTLGKKIFDICPEDAARRRRVDRLTRGDRLL